MCASICWHLFEISFEFVCTKNCLLFIRISSNTSISFESAWWAVVSLSSVFEFMPEPSEKSKAILAATSALLAQFQAEFNGSANFFISRSLIADNWVFKVRNSNFDMWLVLSSSVNVWAIPLVGVNFVSSLDNASQTLDRMVQTFPKLVRSVCFCCSALI